MPRTPENHHGEYDFKHRQDIQRVGRRMST